MVAFSISHVCSQFFNSSGSRKSSNIFSSLFSKYLLYIRFRQEGLKTSVNIVKVAVKRFASSNRDYYSLRIPAAPLENKSNFSYLFIQKKTGVALGRERERENEKMGNFCFVFHVNFLFWCDHRFEKDPKSACCPVSSRESLQHV